MYKNNPGNTQDPDMTLPIVADILIEYLYIFSDPHGLPLA
jgi:hypothetical protein